MKIYSNVTELIGHTPLVRLANIEKSAETAGRLIAKLEKCNPGGSAKDRIAFEMIEAAERDGLLKKGGVIIEPTSGNTGIGLALVAVLKGYKAIIVMPDSMSRERISLMKAFGAQVVLTEGKLGMAGAIAMAERLKEQTEGAIIAGQFENPANSAAHFKTTGPEIWEDTEGSVDAFVACVGTGGTLTGAGKYLKSKNAEVKVIAVEPDASPLLSGGSAAAHKIQGIGANFIPPVLEQNVYDEIVRVTDEEAYQCARRCATQEGILVGISSGAALCAAVKLAKREEYADKNIVVLLPDTGERYLSTENFID